jgi:predicted RNA methylase
MAKTIDPEVAEILSGARCEGDLVTLTCGQLSRVLYVRVNDVLASLGGKWNRKRGGHVFQHDAAAILAEALGTGKYVNKQQENGAFDTPPELAEYVVRRADVQRGHRVLEPSAGVGRLATPCRNREADVHCVELDAERVGVLLRAGFVVAKGDFLATAPTPIFDRVVMNPPFGQNGSQLDIDHVLHAYKFLKKGGKLVAIMSVGWTFRNNKNSREFQEFVSEHGGEWSENEDGAFKESGTGVRTVTLVIDN